MIILEEDLVVLLFINQMILYYLQLVVLVDHIWGVLNFQQVYYKLLNQDIKYQLVLVLTYLIQILQVMMVWMVLIKVHNHIIVDMVEEDGMVHWNLIISSVVQLMFMDIRVVLVVVVVEHIQKVEVVDILEVMVVVEVIQMLLGFLMHVEVVVDLILLVQQHLNN
jgi:hypothetical protein